MGGLMDRTFRLLAVFTVCGAALALAIWGLNRPRNPARISQSDAHLAMYGKPAPDFEGDFAVNGRACKLSDLKGKVVVVDFWAVWCGPCVMTFPHMIELNDEFKSQGLEIVGVTTYYTKYGFNKANGKLTEAKEPLTTDAEQSMLKDFAAYHKLNYLLMTVPNDEYNEVKEAYKVGGIPQAVVIDKKGNVRLITVGCDQPGSHEISNSIKNKVKQLLDE
jgi:thiol-disulfide isomerase/thioredoxin